MVISKIPLIFIHYGDSPYLKYTLHSAVLTNPDKEVILLGDSQNQHYTNLGVQHHFFKDYNTSLELDTFNQVFRIIAGKKHLEKTFAIQWIKFVFERWFYMYNFIIKHDIQRFWTFDSDNLIFSKLSLLEPLYKQYDCTTQCKDICMNGMINNQGVVKGYLDKINELFQNQDFLAQQQHEFDTIHPEYAFTEMRAFEIYKNEASIKTFRINQFLNSESFDECIACEYNNIDMHKDSLFVKKLYIDKSRQIYCFHVPTKTYIKLHNANMSWVPIYFTKRLFFYKFYKPLTHQKITYKLIPIKMPLKELIKAKIKNALSIIKKP